MRNSLHGLIIIYSKHEFFVLQEGQVANMEDVENVLTKDQIKQLQVIVIHFEITLLLHLIQAVCSGAWLNKFSNEGRGQTHSRFTWINPSNTKVPACMHGAIIV